MANGVVVILIHYKSTMDFNFRNTKRLKQVSRQLKPHAVNELFSSLFEQ